MSDRFVPVRHPRFHRADADIFTRRIVADCMTHDCAVVDTRRLRPDACCQYGCDVDVAERDAIVAHRHEIRDLLRPEAKDVPWFEPEEYVVEGYPSGRIVRTEVFRGACIFLAQDARGCAIHRAALEHGFDVRGVKPAVCRLYPLYYEDDAVVIDDDYPAYSCAWVDGPTLYRHGRDTLAELFGPELVVALDEAERIVLARDPHRSTNDAPTALGRAHAPS